jgi:RHS repeat-associated protein
LNLGASGYKYDSGTNLTRFTTNSPLTTLAAAVYQVNKLNQVTAITGNNYSVSINYDANGNPTNGIAAPSGNPNTVTGARSYSWDGANRLVGIDYGSGTSNSTSLSYDGFGRLVKIVESVNGITQNEELFVWIGNAMVQQRNAQGGVVKEYFDQGFANGTIAYYYGKDLLGSIKNLTDSTGTIQAQLDYGPYGEIAATNGNILPDFAYGGLFYHQRSGLYLAEYRAYDGGLKRWLNRDPMLQITGEDPEIAVGPNLYAYASNAPTANSDLEGLIQTVVPNPNSPDHSYPPNVNQLPAQGTKVYSSGTGNTWVYNGHGAWYCISGPAAGTTHGGTQISGGSGQDAFAYGPYKGFDDPPKGGFTIGGVGKIIPKTPNPGGGGDGSGGGGILPLPGGGSGGDGGGGNSGTPNPPPQGQTGNGNGGNSVRNYPQTGTSCVLTDKGKPHYSPFLPGTGRDR